MGSWPVLPWQLALGCWASSQKCPFVSPPTVMVGVLDEFDPAKITLIFASELWTHVNAFKGNNGSREPWDRVQNIQQPLRQHFLLPIDRVDIYENYGFIF